MRDNAARRFRAVAPEPYLAARCRMRDVRSSGASGMRAVQAVSGTVAVFLLLAGTKWASYLGSAPLYLTDALLTLAVVHRLASRQQAGCGPGAPRRSFIGLGWVFALVTWTVFRFIAGARADVDVCSPVRRLLRHGAGARRVPCAPRRWTTPPSTAASISSTARTVAARVRVSASTTSEAGAPARGLPLRWRDGTGGVRGRHSTHAMSSSRALS